MAFSVAPRLCALPSFQILDTIAVRRTLRPVLLLSNGSSLSQGAVEQFSGHVCVGHEQERRRRYLQLSHAVAQGAEAQTAVALKEVKFVWTGAATVVLLTGSFLDWEKKVPLVKGSDGSFQLKQKLSPGEYAYKFIVDGVWLHDENYPTVSDGAGGFNNVLSVPGAANAAAVKPEKKEERKSVAPAAAAAAAPAAKPAGKAAGKKAAAKNIKLAMEEDIVPLLTSTLEKEKGLSELRVYFEDNQLRGTFVKADIPYAFWCYFPDGTLEGARGFSLATHGGSPSTVEPFLIDERKVLPDLLVFWVVKRLFAQKLLSLN
eukprot:TRINITY_DN2546_c0_g1_i2.p1 TRINITY_DN2546_c0_g1~~TRINITY_DN2546_c0_g1_i2.p1  ORF type:complete len:317 (+),score=66.10 TRINITY_DN2546_c0_g1_i2:255-1205(+)